MRSRKVLAIGVLLIGVVTSIGLAYVAGETGVVAQGDMERADVVSPATEVGGIINANTTWTKANSPYSLTSDVQIAPSITLTIEPGVVVNGEGDLNAILVFGTLLVAGSADKEVVFDGINVDIGHNAFDDPPALIDIQHARLNGGSLYGITAGKYGSLRLRDSYLQDLYTHIDIWYPVADVVIERNIFVRCPGIGVGTQSSIVSIRNNVFVDQLNSFGEFGIAVDNWNAGGNSSAVIVEYNSFLSTDRIAVRLSPGYPSTAMDARNNYWNTTNQNVIASMIFDRDDDLSVSTTILYKPFLTAPHPDTPHDLPTPTPTPTPTETPTATPDLIATLTAVNEQMPTAVAATLTAIASQPAGTPQPNQLSLPTILR